MHVCALRGQHGAAVPQGDGGEAPSLKCTEPCVSELKLTSVFVIHPAGLSLGMYKDARLAGTSLVCLLAEPGPGFLFHYWA